MNLSRKLVAYSAGAAAAGLTAVDSADAAIISYPGGALPSGATLDINFEGGNEEYVIGHRTGPNRLLLLKDDQTVDANAYVTTTNAQPAALPFGTPIGPSSTFANAYDTDLANPTTGLGNFSIDNIAGNTEYIGVRFELGAGGPQYYGWIGVDITNASDLTGEVTGYAYDDSFAPVEAGVVPEPAGLALLALGAPFLLRRKSA
jgi:MYXO-CTERM domain-containing protein